MPPARVSFVTVAVVLVLAASFCGGDRWVTIFKEPKRCQNNDQLFDCMDNGRCVAQWRWCDGINDCYDYSDERSCKECTRGALRCNFSGECVPPGSKCNGIYECRDQSDEHSCEYLSEAKQIISLEFRRRVPVTIEIQNTGSRIQLSLFLPFALSVAVLHAQSTLTWLDN